MRTLLTILLLTISFFCQDKRERNEGFKINGNINGLNNSTLMILKFVNDSIEFDSINVVNNKFEYTGKVDEPYFVIISIKEGKSTKVKLTEFMIENSDILIEGNSIDSDSIKVTGSNSDKIFKEYLKGDNVLIAEWNILKLEYDYFVELNDSINKRKTAKKFNKIFKVDRVSLLKEYVTNNSNTIVGALLPSFCPIKNTLTKKDYEEIYNTLSDEIKQTQYGKGLYKIFNEESE